MDGKRASSKEAGNAENESLLKRAFVYTWTSLSRLGRIQSGKSPPRLQRVTNHVLGCAGCILRAVAVHSVIIQR